MFDVGYSEILVIAIVLIVVVGPKDLPKMLRAFGKAMTKFRQVSGDFRRQFDDALKEAELDEVRKTISDMRALDPRQQMRDAFNPLREAGANLKSELSKPVTQPKAAALAEVKVPVIPAVAKPVKATKEKSVTKSVAKPAPASAPAKLTKPSVTKSSAAAPNTIKSTPAKAATIKMTTARSTPVKSATAKSKALKSK